jgi:hypothetical protein
MRKLILIAALVLASATAQAGQSRSLTVAANDEPSAAAPAKAAVTPKVAETPNAAEAPKATEAPTYVDRPALVEPKASQPAAEPAKPVAEKTAVAPKLEKPRRKRYWNEARIINELHRHGIYW